MLYDLIVIGSGPGGQKAALQAAKAGKKVVVVEEYPVLGGGCVHFGTLPSKSFRESVYRFSLGSKGKLSAHARGKHTAGRAQGAVFPDMSRLLQRKNRVIEAEAEVIAQQFKRNKVDWIHGRATLTSPTDVEVKSKKGIQKLKATFVFIAVGARPVAPDHIQVDRQVVLDSNSILGLKKLPKTLVVLGGGIIGCEYASMFATAGTRVFLVDRRNEILASVDREVVGQLVDLFKEQGMEILLENEATKIDIHKKPVSGARATVHLSGGRKLKVEAVLVAQGRFGNTEHLGLENVGVACDDRGLVKVDAHFKTNIPNIYAIGDVVGAPALASTSMEQGRMACCNAFRLSNATMSPLFPYGIYTIPEISMIGLTEEQLKEQKIDFVVGRGLYKEMARGQIVGDKWGLLKLMVERRTKKILGVHILGDSAADLIHIGQAVMVHGGTLDYFIESVFNYPTLAEAYKAAAFSALNQLSSKRLL